MRTIIVTLVVLVAAGFLYAEGEKETTAPAVTGFTEGEITYLEGEVTVDNREAQFGMAVQSGSIVETGVDASCDIVFGEKNILRIYEDTLMEIDFSAGNANMRTGSVGAVFNKLSAVVTEDGSRFTVASPDAVGGVRGTAFFIKVEKPGSTYLCTCYGTMALQDPRGDNRKSVEAYNHEAYRYTTTAATVSTESAPLLYHDDESMEELAAQIGVQIPWKGESGY